MLSAQIAPGCCRRFVTLRKTAIFLLLEIPLAKLFPDAVTTARLDKFERHSIPFFYKYALIHAKTLLKISLDNDVVTDVEKESQKMSEALCSMGQNLVRFLRKQATT